MIRTRLLLVVAVLLAAFTPTPARATSYYEGQFEGWCWTTLPSDAHVRHYMWVTVTESARYPGWQAVATPSYTAPIPPIYSVTSVQDSQWIRGATLTLAYRYGSRQRFASYSRARPGDYLKTRVIFTEHVFGVVNRRACTVRTPLR